MSAYFEEESFGIVPISKFDDAWKVFLILHRAGNHWGFPKGHGHPGEKPLESAMRELKEETGLDVVQILQETPFIEEYSFRKKGQMVSKKVLYFPAIVSGVLNLQEEEIREGNWFNFDEALKVLKFKEARSICQQLMQVLELS